MANSDGISNPNSDIQRVSRNPRGHSLGRTARDLLFEWVEESMDRQTGAGEEDSRLQQAEQFRDHD